MDRTIKKHAKERGIWDGLTDGGELHTIISSITHISQQNAPFIETKLRTTSLRSRAIQSIDDKRIENNGILYLKGQFVELRSKAEELFRNDLSIKAFVEKLNNLWIDKMLFNSSSSDAILPTYCIGIGHSFILDSLCERGCKTWEFVQYGGYLTAVPQLTNPF